MLSECIAYQNAFFSGVRYVSLQVPTGSSVSVQERGNQTFMAVHSVTNNTLQVCI